MGARSRPGLVRLWISSSFLALGWVLCVRSPRTRSRGGYFVYAFDFPLIFRQFWGGYFVYARHERGLGVGTLCTPSGYFVYAYHPLWLTAVKEKWYLPEVLPEYLPDVEAVETVDMWIRALKPHLLGMWFLGFACMARVNNASTRRVSCCDPRVPIRHTRQIDFCEQKSMYRKIKRSLRERLNP